MSSKLSVSNQQLAVILRTADDWLRARIKELLPDFSENDTQVVYIAENQSDTWHFEARESAVYNTIVIVEAGGRLELNYEISAMSMSHRHIVLGEGSELILNDLAVSDETIEMTTRLTAKAGARVKNVAILLGGNQSIVDYGTNLAGEGAATEQWGLMMLGGNEQAKFQVGVNHSIAGCRSNELIKGIASGRARGEFSGLVYVARDAQRTEALQESRNLLLGDDCQIVTSPQLEIYADDVKCSHGATVGQMGDDALFYMRQRGLDEPTARRLQLTGFVADIVERIEDEQFRERAMQVVENKLIKM